MSRLTSMSRFSPPASTRNRSVRDGLAREVSRRMRVAALVVLLAIPACVTSPVPDPDPDPHHAEGDDCGIPELRVEGDVRITITRTATGEGCPYVYDRTDWWFVAGETELPIDTTDSPVEVQSSTVGSGYEEVPVTIALTDEWGVGPTSDDLTNIRAPVAFDLVFDSEGGINGTATATIPWNDATCIVSYAATGSFTPEWQ